MATTITPTIPLVGAFGNAGSTIPLNLAPIVPQTPTAGAPNPSGLASAMTTASSTPAVPQIAPNLSTSLSAALASLSKSLQSYVAPSTPVVPATTPAAMSLPYTQPANSDSTIPFSPTQGGTINPAAGTITPITPTVTGFGGSGSGGGKAPAGMMYNGQGQLVPISSGPANVGTNSGAVVNPATGAVVTPATTVPSTSATGVPASTPVVPTTTPTTTPPAVPGTTAPPSSVAGAESAIQADEAQLGSIASNYNQSIINTDQQGGGMAFLTGEQARLAQEEGTLEAPLEAKLQADQTVLGTAQQQNTPITVAPGATAITPAEAAANPSVLGTGAAGAAATSDLATSPTAPNGAPFDPTSALDVYTQQYMTSGNLPTNAQAQGMISQIIERANQLSMQQIGQPFIAATAQNQQSSSATQLTSLQGQQSQAQASMATMFGSPTNGAYSVGGNAQLLLNGMTAAGLNASTLPVVNAIQQAAEENVINPGQQAAMNNSLNTLQNEYAKLLVGTGVTTDATKAAASAAVLSTLSPADLAQTLQRIMSEGQNFLTGLGTSISNVQNGLSPYNFGGAPSSSSTTLGTSGATTATTAASSGGWASLGD